MSETPALLLKTVQTGRVIPAVAQKGHFIIYLYFLKRNWLSEKLTVLFCKSLHSGYMAIGAK